MGLQSTERDIQDLRRRADNTSHTIDAEQQKRDRYEQAGDDQHALTENSMINRLEHERSLYHDQIQRKQNEARTIEEHIKDIDRQISPLEKEIAAIQSNINRENGKIATLQQRVDDLNSVRQNFL